MPNRRVTRVVEANKSAEMVRVWQKPIPAAVIVDITLSVL